MQKTIEDGLFVWPYTSHDWTIVSLALLGYLFRMYLMYRTPDVKNPTPRDWFGIFVLTALCTVSLYEFALYRQWPLRMFMLPFSIAVILAKDISDWLFMSREGKRFVLATIRELIGAVLGRAGYVKKE